jgi:hypothetical protein
MDSQTIAQSAAIGELLRVLSFLQDTIYLDSHGPLRLGCHGGHVHAESAEFCCEEQMYLGPGTPGKCIAVCLAGPADTRLKPPGASSVLSCNPSRGAL